VPRMLRCTCDVDDDGALLVVLGLGHPQQSAGEAVAAAMLMANISVGGGRLSCVQNERCARAHVVSLRNERRARSLSPFAMLSCDAVFPARLKWGSRLRAHIRHNTPLRSAGRRPADA
jgi:hypothetical protein